MDSQNPYRSPQFEVDTHFPEYPEHQKQSLAWILFSFQGRIPRRVFWTATLAIAFFYYAWLFIGFMIYRYSNATPIFMFSSWIPVGWTGLAVQVKRWHDLDKSGWWVLIWLIPAIGPIWAFVKTGCLRGTYGTNRFGNDPACRHARNVHEDESPIP